MANRSAFSDQSLTTLNQQGEIGRIEELLHRMMGGDYDDMVANVNKLADEFEITFADAIGCKREQGRAVLQMTMEGFRKAARETDWRLGYGRVRDDATIPEVAVNVIIHAARLLGNAFSTDGIRSYRNREHDFVTAMAEFAEQANGGLADNMSFYEKLGREVSQAVLDHKLAGPQPLLAPHVAVRREIETAAMTQLVYFVQVGDDGPIKIGIAQDPAARLNNLQTAHHDKLNMRAITVGGADQERAYHAQFAEHRKRGEWFSPAPEILAEIDRLKAA